MTEPILRFSQRKLGFVETANNQIPLMLVTYLLVILVQIFKVYVGSYIYESGLNKFPHFTSPLIDVREMKEMFYNFEKTGHFLNSPVQIGQSEALTAVLYYIYTGWGDFGLRVFL